MASLPASIRNRVTFTVIGSATAIARQLSALYVRGEKKPVLAIFDGDQQTKESDNLGHAIKMSEKPKPDFHEWFKNHVCYLPGDAWPELWLLQKAHEVITPLASVLGTDINELTDILEYGLQAGKHNEFHEIAKHVGLDEQSCMQHFTSVICHQLPNEFSPVVEKISSILNSNA